MRRNPAPVSGGASLPRIRSADGKLKLFPGVEAEGNTPEGLKTQVTDIRIPQYIRVSLEFSV